MITNHSVVVAAKKQTFSQLIPESVPVNPKAGVYHQLNAVETTIWSLIQQPMAIAEIRDAILTKYAIEPYKCEQDLLKLLKELSQQGLIEVSDQRFG